MNFLEKYGLKLILIFILFASYSITAQSKTLLILGDSISAGYGIKEADNWVTLLQQNYAARDLEIKIINSDIYSNIIYLSNIFLLTYIIKYNIYILDIDYHHILDLNNNKNILL